MTEHIKIGYQWGYRIEVQGQTSAYFPSGCELLAHVKMDKAEPLPRATLTTANGGLTRVDDNTIDIVVTAAQTATLLPGTAVFDIVRTDTSVDVNLGIEGFVTVEQPPTRPA
jgi:hypothetical protein